MENFRNKNLNIDVIVLITFSVLCFANIPLLLRMDSLSSGFSGKLAWYPLVTIFIGTVAYKIKEKSFSKMDKIFLAYSLVTIVWNVLVTVKGYYEFPYYNSLILSKITESEYNAITKISSFMHMGFETSVDIYYLVKVIKGSIFNYIYTYGFAYTLYLLIKKNKDRSFTLLQKGIGISAVFILSFFVLELFYLAHFQWADQLLGKINPLFHSVRENNTWWPPLYWENQARSFFAEPSYVGIYGAMAMPVIWSFLWDNNSTKQKRNIFLFVIVLLFSFMIWMTQARTAIFMMGGEFILWSIILLFTKYEDKYKLFTKVLSAIVIGGIISVLFISWTKQESISESVDEYTSHNITSIADDTRQSTGTRKAVTIANFEVGIEKLTFGTGLGLSSPYVEDKLPLEMREVGTETGGWIKGLYEKGVFKAGIPNMGEYVTKFAQLGLIGVILHMLPWIGGLYYFAKSYIRKKEYNDLKMNVTIFVATMGTLITGFSDNLTILYTPWILLAFLFVKTDERG